MLTISIGAIASGPSLALITMGILIPWINATGALVGGISGLVFMSWLCLKTQAAIAIGDITFPEKPVSTDGCHYHFTPKSASGLEKGSVHLDASLDITEVIHTDETMMIYRLSYLWYVLIGMIVSIAVGVLTSFITKPNDPRDIDPRLLAKFIRKFIKPREFPNQPPNDEIIYAYERPNVKINQAAKGKTEEISGAPQNI